LTAAHRARGANPEQSQALVLREFERPSYCAITDAMGIPTGMVRSRIDRARVTEISLPRLKPVTSVSQHRPLQQVVLC